MSAFGNDFYALIARRQKALAAVSELADPATGGLGVASAMMSVTTDILWQITVDQFTPETTYDARQRAFVAMLAAHGKEAAMRAAKPPQGALPN